MPDDAKQGSYEDALEVEYVGIDHHERRKFLLSLETVVPSLSLEVNKKNAACQKKHNTLDPKVFTVLKNFKLKLQL